MRGFFVTGNGTGAGKTITSAILCEAQGADYWKPIQAGFLDNSDSQVVRSLVSNSNTFVHPEVYLLSQPLSPHAAAKIDGVKIEISKLQLPSTPRPLVVEGVGGLMSPISDDSLNIDLIAALGLPAIVVSQHYLGSINHTLLTLEALKQRKIEVLGLIFNGPSTPSSEDFILAYSGTKRLAQIPQREHWGPAEIRSLAHGSFQGVAV